MILSNGVTILESPYPNGNDIEICILNYGAIRDVHHGIVGIQHLLEHKAFTTKDLNMNLNASTAINHMYFHITGVNSNKTMLKALQMWLCKTPKGIKIAHNCNIVDIQRCVYEIDNEYTYRNVSYDLHDLLYFILMEQASMFFCGNVRTFIDLEKIKGVIDNLEYIQPQDIIVLYQKRLLSIDDEIDTLDALRNFFSQFRPFKVSTPKIDLSLKSYYRKYIETDTLLYQILFKIDEKHFQDAIYMPLIIHNCVVNQNTLLKGCFVRFFFETNYLFQDFLYLLEAKRYHDLSTFRIFVEEDTFFYFVRAKKADELFLRTTDLLNIATPKVNNVFNHIRQQYINGEFVVLGPRSVFTSIEKTISGEPVKISDFIIDFENYIYDYSYKKYLMSNISTSSTGFDKMKKTSLCFYPNLELRMSQNLPQRNTSLEETIRYLIQNILKAAPLNYELGFTLDEEKLIANEKYDIHFSGNSVTIKTKYDFTLFLLKLDKTTIGSFYLVLHTYLYQQKDLGNIYYFKIHFIKFSDYIIMTLFSNPTDYLKWKNSMVNFFDSFNFTSYYLIQSEKSKIYDLSNLEKTTTVTF